MQVSEANQEYNEEIIAERETILQRKKDKILKRFVSAHFIALNFKLVFRQYDDVKKLREEQEARGCSFYQMIDDFKNTLKHEDYTLTEDIITDIEWMENYIFTLGESLSGRLSDNQLLELLSLTTWFRYAG